MTEQKDTAALLREVSEKLAEANDKLTAAQLQEQKRREQVRERLDKFARSFIELADWLEERCCEANRLA